MAKGMVCSLFIHYLGEAFAGWEMESWAHQAVVALSPCPFPPVQYLLFLLSDT